MQDREVGRMLEIALDVAKRLPPVKSLGPGNVFRHIVAARGTDDPEEIEYRLTHQPCTSDEIALFDFAAEAMEPYPVMVRKLVWMRAGGDKLRHIARMLGYNPQYLGRLYRQTILELCTSLTPPDAVWRVLVMYDGE